MERPAGEPLTDYAGRICSQHGEDGVTVEVFRRIGVQHRRAVEIGCGSNGGNAGILVAGLSFDALLMDGNAQLAELCQNIHPTATVISTWIDAEHINGLLETHGFDHDLDYLGIDLDGIDYWIWRALKVQPRVVICEYNRLFGPDASVVIPYRADFNRKAKTPDGSHSYPKCFYGASLVALERLGRERGYFLVGTAPNSDNAYFVRDDAAKEWTPLTPKEVWTPRTKGEQAEAITEAVRKSGPVAYFKEQGAELVEV